MRSGVKHTWLPWRRKYRPIPMPDGGTLQRIPEEKVGPVTVAGTCPPYCW